MPGASLAALRRVEVVAVGFQRRFDLLQDFALLQDRPSRAYVAQSGQEQVGHLPPQRRLVGSGRQRLLDRLVAVLFHSPTFSYIAPDSGGSFTRLESLDWIARNRPSPPRKAPSAVSGQATSRGKRAPSNDAPSRAPLAATAMACSWVCRGAVPFWMMVGTTLDTVAPDPVPLPATPARALLSLVSTGPCGLTLGPRPEVSRPTSLLPERSFSKSSSICRAKPSSSTSRSISQLAARLLKFRFVEPTFESQPSATRVLAWIMGPPYSKILTPASRNCR